jgi:predicted negative regulator of RcsB-dependent stress response
MRFAGALLMIWIALGVPAFAQQAPAVGLRVGSHPTYGRVVMDWPEAVPYRAEEAGNRLILRFGSPARYDLSGALRLPKNVESLSAIDGGIVLQAPPGTRFRHYRLGNRVVIDVLDGAEAGTTAPAPTQAGAAPPPAVPPRPATAPPAAPAARPPPTAPPPREAAPQTSQAAIASAPAPSAADVSRPEAGLDAGTSPQVAPASIPPAPAVTPSPSPASPPAPAQAQPAPAARPLVVVPPRRTTPVRLLAEGRAISLDLGAETAAAVFRLGDWVIAVFDRPEALDLSQLQGSAIFRSMEARQTGDASILQMRLAQPGTLRPRREGNAWVLEAFRDAVEANRALTAITPELDQGPPARLVLRATRPGRSVTVLDPETGSPLLVGPLREPGQAVAIGRRQPEFQLLPAMLGVAVQPRGDNIQLRALQDRFILQASGMDSLRLGMDAGREPLAEAATLSRIMDLPSAGAATLQERLRTASANIAAAGPLGRSGARRDAAETLLALGMPQEAQAMAGLALQEDPRAGADARLVMVQAAAALLAGREAEARQLENPQMPSTDETTLWRGFLAAARGDHAVAGPAIAASLPLLLSYPRPLAQRLIPIAMESLAISGELTAATRLGETDPDNPTLNLARGMIAEGDGRIDDALAAYRLAMQGRDRQRRARAIRRSVELRLAIGQLDAAGAITELEAALFAWRGDAEEVNARIRLAELQREAGNGRAAFELLQETQRFFPERENDLRPHLRAAFAAALQSAPPLNAAAFFDAHPEFLPEDEAGIRSVLVLADRLAALDLVDRASAVLRDALGRLTDPAARKPVSTKLAALRLSEGDAPGALAALDAATEGSGEEVERTILRGRALARAGNRRVAEGLLSELGDDGAEALAEIRAEAQDWSGAASAMLQHIDAKIPPAPAPLSPAMRRDLARAAAYAAMGNDTNALAQLRDNYGARMQGGPLAEAFALLTSESLRGVQDLPRLQREISQLRLLPQRLGDLNTAAPPRR